MDTNTTICVNTPTYSCKFLTSVVLVSTSVTVFISDSNVRKSRLQADGRRRLVYNLEHVLDTREVWQLLCFYNGRIELSLYFF